MKYFKKFLILPDLHGGFPLGPPRSIPIQDGADWRIYSNWEDRLLEACAVGVAESCDAFVLLGDNMESQSPNGQEVTIWESILTIIQTNFSEKTSGTGTIVPLMGNHERAAVLEVTEFGGSYTSTVSSDFRVTFSAPDVHWPGLRSQGRSSNFAWIDTDFSILGTTSFNDIDTIWDATGVEYETGLTNSLSQLDWFETKALPVSAGKPTIIFSHYHLSDIFGSALPDRILSGTPSNSDINIQTQLASHVSGGDPVYVFQGHFHKVIDDANDKQTAIWDMTDIGGVEYYSLRGSILGKNSSDLRGNTCFVVTVDTVTGVSIKTYQYSSTARDRYNPLDIDNIVGTNQRRSRYSN